MDEELRREEQRLDGALNCSTDARNDVRGLVGAGTSRQDVERRATALHHAISGGQVTDAELLDRARAFDRFLQGAPPTKAQPKAGAAPEAGSGLGDALVGLKCGMRVARAGWNGQGMWLAWSPGAPCITMKTASGAIQMGWAPTVSDLLAMDWLVLG